LESNIVIVISGALLVVAVVFLVIGLWVSVAWVYPSIGAGLIAFILMLIVIRQQKNLADEPAPPLHPVGSSDDVPQVPAAAPIESPVAGDDGGDGGDAGVSGDADPGEPEPDVGLVPATPKSAARKPTASTPAATPTATGKVSAAKRPPAAKRAPAKRQAADRTTEPTAAKKTTRKAAPRKPAEQPAIEEPDDSPPSES
jgi:hypothetical protein